MSIKPPADLINTDACLYCERVFLYAEVAEWQTRTTQNRVPTRYEGSSPSFGTTFAFSKNYQQNGCVIYF